MYIKEKMPIKNLKKYMLQKFLQTKLKHLCRQAKHETHIYLLLHE